MALTGIDPNDPTPSTRRELIFAAGQSPGGGEERFVLIYGNKLLAGSEDTNVINGPIADDADAQARFGARSEWYLEYQQYVEVDPAATIYGCAVPEPAGSQASVDLTVAAPPSPPDLATTAATLEIACLGHTATVGVATGDHIDDIATNIAVAINGMNSGQLPLGASTVGPVVTVTFAHNGVRGDLALGATTTTGLRVRWLNSTNVTVTKGALVGGTGVDDAEDAYAAAAEAGEYYYQVSPFTATAAVSATDGQVGEGINYVKTQALPINGKEQQMFFGLVGTQAQATAVATSAGANDVRGKFYRSELSDWLPGQIAAHHAAVNRSQQIAQPSANIAGYASTSSTVYTMPAPFLKANWPTETEIKADLNNGVSPIGVHPNGAAYLVRDITSRSQDGAGNKDYRAREGHIVSAIDFAWSIIKQRWNEQKQPFVADDPIEGKKPTKATMTPSAAKAMIFSVIDDLTVSRPFGLYDGPILAPDKVDKMKASVVATKIPAGISVVADLVAVEHLLKFEGKFSEVGGAY